MDKFRYSDLQALASELPSDIRSRKEFGDFEGVQRLIEKRLQENISEEMKARLRVEREICRVLPGDYPYTLTEALELVRTVHPDLTEEQFRDLQDRGRIDWIYVNGEEHFIHSTARTLRKDVEKAEMKAKSLRTGKDPKEGTGSTLYQSVLNMRANGSDSRRFTIRMTLKIRDEAFRPGRIKVYLPVVCAAGYVSDIKIEKTSSEQYILADADAPQRTICFTEDIRENHEFFVEYSYTVKAMFHDLWTEEAVEANRKAIEAAKAEAEKTETAEAAKAEAEKTETAEAAKAEAEKAETAKTAKTKTPDSSLAPYLQEHLPHIRFTPFMKALAHEIADGCETDLEKARAIYDYITTQVTYSFVRSYFAIENQGEYVIRNRKGDCGLQALAFITLCRILGIPAKWESGNEFGDCQPGSHDWAMVYLEPFGWLYADPSYGGGAHREGAEMRRQHYFGNLDPYRLPCNEAFQEEFDPPMEYLRNDPYDNQSGEVEYEDGSLSWDDYDTVKELVEAIHLV